MLRRQMQAFLIQAISMKTFERICSSFDTHFHSHTHTRARSPLSPPTIKTQARQAYVSSAHSTFIGFGCQPTQGHSLETFHEVNSNVNLNEVAHAGMETV